MMLCHYFCSQWLTLHRIICFIPALKVCQLHAFVKFTLNQVSEAIRRFSVAVYTTNWRCRVKRGLTCNMTASVFSVTLQQGEPVRPYSAYMEQGSCLSSTVARAVKCRTNEKNVGGINIQTIPDISMNMRTMCVSLYCLLCNPVFRWRRV